MVTFDSRHYIYIILLFTYLYLYYLVAIFAGWMTYALSDA